MSKEEILKEIEKMDIGDEIEYEVEDTNNPTFDYVEGNDKNSRFYIDPFFTIIKQEIDKFEVKFITIEEKGYVTYENCWREPVHFGDYEECHDTEVDWDNPEINEISTDSIILSFNELKKAIEEDFNGWI